MKKLLLVLFVLVASGAWGQSETATVADEWAILPNKDEYVSDFSLGYLHALEQDFCLGGSDKSSLHDLSVRIALGSVKRVEAMVDAVLAVQRDWGADWGVSNILSAVLDKIVEDTYPDTWLHIKHGRTDASKKEFS